MFGLRHAAHYAEESEFDVVVSRRFAAQYGCTPLHMAAANGQESCVSMLLKAKAPMNTFDKVRSAYRPRRPSLRRSR